MFKLIKKLFQPPQNLTHNELARMLNVKSESGYSVTGRSALNYAPVFQAVNMISGDIGKQCLKVYKRVEDGKQIDEKHNAARVVCNYPNEWTSAKRFWTDFVFHYLFWGNAYAWIERESNGRIKGLWNLRPDKTAYDPEQDVYVSEIGSDIRDHKIVKFRKDDIVHCRFFSVPGFVEPALLVNARESWAVGLAAQGFSGKFLNSSCNVGGILSIPSVIPKEKRKNIIEGWDRTYTGQAFKVAILTDGVQFHRVSMNAEESQFNETRVTQSREVANWFNLPPSKLGIPDSGGYGSRTEDNRNYLEQTLTPILSEIAGEANCKLLTKMQKKKDSHFWQHDTRDLMRADPKTAADTHKIYRELGVLNANEIRGDLGRNPIEHGDEYWTPNANHQQGESSTESEESPAEELDVIENELRKWINLTENTINRQREKKSPERFEKWLEEFSPTDFEYRSQAEAQGLQVPNTESFK